MIIFLLYFLSVLMTNYFVIVSTIVRYNNYNNIFWQISYTKDKKLTNKILIKRSNLAVGYGTSQQQCTDSCTSVIQKVNSNF